MIRESDISNYIKSYYKLSKPFGQISLRSHMKRDVQLWAGDLDAKPRVAFSGQTHVAGMR